MGASTDAAAPPCWGFLLSSCRGDVVGSGSAVSQPGRVMVGVILLYDDAVVDPLDWSSRCDCHLFMSSNICFFIWAGVGSAMCVATYHV